MLGARLAYTVIGDQLVDGAIPLVMADRLAEVVHVRTLPMLGTKTKDRRQARTRIPLSPSTGCD